MTSPVDVSNLLAMESDKSCVKKEVKLPPKMRMNLKMEEKIIDKAKALHKENMQKEMDRLNL